MLDFGPLVDAVWLAGHRDQVTVFDSRKYLDGRSGRDEYEHGHIPGAVFVDLDADLAAQPAQPGGRHPFPTPAHFATAMSRLGYDGTQPAVVYDDVGGGMAARLWFMLTLLDIPAAILEGGIQTWPAELDTGSAPVEAAVFAERPWPTERLIEADEVADRIAGGGVVIDARSAARYAGTPNAIDPRFGHIPGAISLPWEANLDESTGAFRDVALLRDRYAAVVDGPMSPKPVAYCGSGVTACHDLLVMHLLGVEGDLYVGSWSEWGADETRPLETVPPSEHRR